MKVSSSLTRISFDWLHLNPSCCLCYESIPSRLRWVLTSLSADHNALLHDYQKTCFSPSTTLMPQSSTTSHSQQSSMNFAFNNYPSHNIPHGSSNTFWYMDYPPPDATCWICPHGLPSTHADATSGGGKPVYPVPLSSHATLWESNNKALLSLMPHLPMFQNWIGDFWILWYLNA